MVKDLIKALGGKLQWDLMRKRKIEWHIFMPHENEEYNYLALEYLDAFLDMKTARNACIYTSDIDIQLEVQTRKWRHAVDVKLKSKPWIHRITKFYALYEFSSNVKIISLTEPYDTGGENLLGVHNVTKRELLCYDIYGFKEIP